MARLRHPKIKEVSLALNPANQKRFLFKKEEDIMDEEVLKEINEKLDVLLDGEEVEVEKAANPLKTIASKVAKLVEMKGKAPDKKTMATVIDTLDRIVKYLQTKDQGGKPKYGYPAPEGKVKKEENVPSEENKNEDEELDPEEIKRIVKKYLN